MRRMLIAGVAAIATFATVVLPASASFDSHFAVISETVQSHETDDGVRFREHLFQIDNPSNRIGRDKGGCAPRPNRKFKCKVLVHLNGEVGGFGDLRINGNFGFGDRRLNVTGGTDDFAGVAGKVVVSERGTVQTFSLVD